MLGRIMDFQTLYNPSRFSWRERFVKGRSFMGIKIIHYKNDLLGIREHHI